MDQTDKDKGKARKIGTKNGKRMDHQDKCNQLRTKDGPASSQRRTN